MSRSARCSFEWGELTPSPGCFAMIRLCRLGANDTRGPCNRPELKKEDPRLADGTVPVEDGYTVVKDVKIG